MNLHSVQYTTLLSLSRISLMPRLLGANKSGIVAVLLCVDPVRKETLTLDHWL